MHLHSRRIPAALLAAVVILAGSATSAAADPFGAQNPLGSLLGDITSAERPAMAAGDGRSLVAWRQFTDKDDRGSDSGWGIGGRFVDGDGAPIGDAFEIAPPASCCSRPSRPDVTYNAARDEFLVVWRAAFSSAFLYAQRVDADGTLPSERVTVTDTGTDAAEVARVAWASDVDEYLVVWDEDHDLYRSEGFDDEDVLGLRLSGEDAEPLSDESPLRLSDGVHGEDFPDVAYDAASGKWLVAFEGVESEQGRGEPDDDVFATTVTPEEEVSGPSMISTGLRGVDRPAVAANTNHGGFAVAWSREEQLITRESFDGDIVARLVGGDGAGTGEEVEVSSATDAPYAASPAIAYDDNADGYLVVWWQEASQSGPDQAVGRRIDAALAPLGDAQVLSVVDDLELRGFGAITGARQPVVGYDRSTCKYVSAYEIAGGSTNVASRGFDAPDCGGTATAPPVLSRRDSTVRGAETVTSGTAASALPRRCTSRRVFSIRLVSRKGRRYRSATITVNGKVVKRLSGDRREALIDLEGLPKGTFTVRLTAKLADGRTLRYTRRYRTCAPKLRDSNRLSREEAV